jgi:hypothetical protein
MATDKDTPSPRLIRVIAAEIFRAWPNISVHARPYLRAMLSLDDMNDMFMMESANTIISYFLSNATYWRGEDARRIKAELRSMMK